MKSLRVFMDAIIYFLGTLLGAALASGFALYLNGSVFEVFDARLSSIEEACKP